MSERMSAFQRERQRLETLLGARQRETEALERQLAGEVDDQGNLLRQGLRMELEMEKAKEAVRLHDSEPKLTKDVREAKILLATHDLSARVAAMEGSLESGVRALRGYLRELEALTSAYYAYNSELKAEAATSGLPDPRHSDGGRR